MRELRNIPGYAGYSEAQNIVLSQWLWQIKETFRSFGFSQLFPHPYEIGSQDEWLNRIKSKHAPVINRSYDGRLPLASWVAKNSQHIIFPYKRYGLSYSLPAEGSLVAHLPSFLRADVDVIGYKTLGLSVDIECIFTIYEALRQLQIRDLLIYLNHLQLGELILKSIANLSDEKIRPVLTILHDMPKAGIEATTAALLQGINAAKVKLIIELFSYKGTPNDFLKICPFCNDELEIAISELNRVFSDLMSFGVPKESLLFWPGNLHEFTHYSRIIYKVIVPGMEMGAIASGGRYDSLVPTVSPLQLPGAGGFIDITRLFAIASQKGWLDLSRRSESQIFIGFRHPDLKILAQYLAVELRRKGLRVDLYSGEGNVKKQFTYAGNKGIPALIMIMDGAAYVVRDLVQGTQIEVPKIERAAEEAMKLVTQCC